MSLETATYIDSLVVTNPDGGDQATTLDDHIRLIKAALKRTFPNVTAEVSLNATQLNQVTQQLLPGVAATVSATYSFSAMPILTVGSVAYDMQGNYGAVVNTSGTLLTAALTGWSSTYIVATSLYRLFHPLNRQPWGDRMAVALAPTVVGTIPYLTSASASAYIEYGMADVSASARLAACQVVINTW
jgi:hypothetical protein